MNLTKAGRLSQLLFSFVITVTTVSVSSALDIQQTIRSPMQPNQVTLVISPTQKSSADILVVLDDSGSMASHQQKLASGVSSLANELQVSFASAHVGVTTTSVCNNQYAECKNGKMVGSPHHVLQPSSPNFVQQLMANTLVGTNGSADEMPFAAAIAALSSPMLENDNAGFLRPSAHLAVVFVTDAEDQSPQTPEELISFLEKTKGTGNFSLSAFVVNSLDCPTDSYATPEKIKKAVALANGHVYDICNADYAVSLKDIASELSQFLDHSVQLPYLPVLSSITVKYGNVQLAVGDIHHGWTYNSKDNTIVLGDEINWASMPAGNLEIQFTIKP